jgi:hypothetical protein
MSNGQQELWEGLQVKDSWFHVVRGWVQSGQLREVGPVGLAVYIVLKSYTSFDTGWSWPSHDTIADHLGISVDTVARAVKRLVALNLVEQRRRGRGWEYRLMERVPVANSAGDVVAVGERPYAPMQFKSMLDELKSWAATGAGPGGGVNITLNVTLIQQTPGSTVNVQNVSLGSIDPAHSIPVPPDMPTLLARLRALKS